MHQGLGYSAHPAIAGVLACTPQVLGPAPSEFVTPFLVTHAQTRGNQCEVGLVTNGVAYETVGSKGACSHAPQLNTLVWGKVRDNTTQLDLVYETHPKTKTALYAIIGRQAIGADFGQPQAPLPANPV